MSTDTEKKRKVYVVSVHQTVAATFAIEAGSLQEARDAVLNDLDADWDNEAQIDWCYALNEGEVASTEVYEGEPGDSDADFETDEEPDFTVKDGRLASTD